MQIIAGELSRSVDVGLVIFLISFSIVLSAVVLIFDQKTKARNTTHYGTAPLLAAHLCFLMAAVSLELGRYVPLWISSGLVTLGALHGLFFGYIGMLANISRKRPRWDKIWFATAIGLSELALASWIGRLEALILITSIVSGAICIYFAMSIWNRSRFLNFTSWGFTAPFVIVAISYLTRPIVFLTGNYLIITVSSIGIALAFSLAAFFWVFGSMSLRSFLLAQDLEHAVNHDSLTGLENRYSFEAFRRKLPQEERRNSRNGFACVFIDLDFFKAVNDTYGHEAGDLVLVETARRLRKICAGDDRIFRMGGDEFVVWHFYREASEVERVLGDIVSSLCVPVQYGDAELTVGASLGAHLSEGRDSPLEVIRKADLAVYASKRSGRSCYTIYSDDLVEAPGDDPDPDAHRRDEPREQPRLAPRVAVHG